MNEIGTLRQRVAVQRAVLLGDGGGGQDQSWVETASLWARVMPLRGRLQVSATRPQALVTHQVTVRCGADIRNSDRLVYRGRVLRIEAIVNRDEADEWLDIACSEDALG